MKRFLNKSRWDRLGLTHWRKQVIFLAIAILMIASSWLGLLSPRIDLIFRNITVNSTPMQFVVSKSATSAPGVLVAHGYCGSKQLMLGYAETLAHNGYGVLLWDLPGHGANTLPFEYDAIQSSFELPLDTLKAQPEINQNQLAVVGHSMGSGIAMEGAIAHEAEIDAVVAISPTGAAVTPNTPKNLSLQLGVWESFLEDNANRLLKQAGGTNDDLPQGKGRSLSKIRNAEHATILFKDQSHQETLDWLNQTFGITSTHIFRDRRMAWYGIHLLGWIMVLNTVLPHLTSEKKPTTQSFSLWRSLGGLGFSAVVGAIPLKVLAQSTSVENFAGLMIGGALGLWFLITGLIWLGLLGKIPRLQSHDLKIGFASYIFLWLGFGAMAQVTWLPWLLTLRRLGLWGLIAIACIPWFLAFSQVLENTTLTQRFAWWLAHSLCVIGGLILAIIAVPNLGFLAIMLPVFPLLLVLFSYLEMKTQSIWGCTFASVGIFSWLIVVPFPIL